MFCQKQSNETKRENYFKMLPFSFSGRATRDERVRDDAVSIAYIRWGGEGMSVNVGQQCVLVHSYKGPLSGSSSSFVFCFFFCFSFAFWAPPIFRFLLSPLFSFWRVGRERMEETESFSLSRL